MTFELSAKAAALMPAPPQHDPGTPAPGEGSGQASESAGEMGFADLIDIVNPLQHLPGISSIYRELTGDTIEAPARVAGGMLYGGPIGFVTSTFNTLMAEATGDDIGGHVMASLFGTDETPQSNATALAEAPPRPEAKPREQLAGADRATGSASATNTAAAGDDATARNAAGQARTGSVLTGREALAALANDLRAGGAQGDGKEAATEDAVEPATARTAQAGADVGKSAAPSSGDFMPITARDYDQSAGAHTRSVRQLRAAASPAAADPESGPRHSALNAQAAAGDPGTGDDPALPADFAERMREALRKYRAMHESN